MDIKVTNWEDLPQLLKEVPGSPYQLFSIGGLPHNDELTIALVGTRKATTAGIKIAEDFGRSFASLGIVVVSGLAMGIDTAAHRGALMGGRKTIAVLGNGLDKIYPAQNENLAKKIIAEDGAVVSEYVAGTPSFKQNFIQRNRIISGLSLAVVVIEAPLKSGALATASFAASQGREVFVVPGPANHPNYIGSHALIRDGARLVTSPKDVIDDLGLNILPSPEAEKSKRSPASHKLTSDENIVLDEIKGHGLPLNVDKIIELTKLSPQIVSQTLTSLVVRGFIQEAGGGYTI
ncbi:MAG: DNA-processing protein DprA [Candidatus Taylorbacteria bacterium]|nr:DNA-processing protein DprA [Candidatus Taylorbacteria bacterium]